MAGLDDIEHVGPADEGPDVGDEHHACVADLVRQLGERVEESSASAVSQSTVTQLSLALSSQEEITAWTVLTRQQRSVSGTSTSPPSPPPPHLQHSQNVQVSWGDGGVVINLKNNIPS